MKYFATVISAIFAVVFAVLCGFVAWREYGLWVIAVSAAMVLSLPLSSLLHELGHMLFGAICKIKAVPKFKLFGSSCCNLIPKTDKKLRVRLFFTALGGVLVNLAVSVIIIFVVRYAAAPAWLTFLVPSNVYLLILNIFPAWFNSGKTDGLVCNDLLNNNDAAKVLLAVLTVQAQVLNGKTIEEVDEKLLFGLPQIQEDDPAFISLTELRYEYFKAKGEEEKAELWQTRFEELKKEYL
ncbi:MAG: hypothetical protein K2O89_07660 [Clostridia bacterium]|nr:hypothetical protein [Clostridia bacterium]